MTPPRNITNLQEKRLRNRAKDMLDLKGLNWSDDKIANALDISRAMVRKTLAQIPNAKEGSLYWRLT